MYGIEASEMAERAQEAARRNNLAVTVLHGRAETVELPEKVDVIVSEWMGTLLIFEFMIESVLVARQRFLKAGGLMLPSKALLHVCLVSAEDYYQSTVGFWSDVYGFDMSSYM